MKAYCINCKHLTKENGHLWCPIYKMSVDTKAVTQCSGFNDIGGMSEIPTRDMKANELMIGDWFQTTYPTGKVEFRKVEGVMQNHIVCNNGVTNAIEPIPLTAEILEKNGFKPQKGINKFIYENEHCHIEIICTTTVYIKGDTFRITIIIENVHELQHALRLCGIDKEIVI